MMAVLYHDMKFGHAEIEVIRDKNLQSTSIQEKSMYSKNVTLAVCAVCAVCALSACRHTLPGTHVEVIDKGGERVYHTGAASIGHNKTLACGGAHKRAVAAIALRFAQDNGSLADDVAEAVGVSDGEVFLQRFAKHDARIRAGGDVQFDPIEHTCMVTVTWKAPIFVKDAVLKVAEEIKAAEIGDDDVDTAPASTAMPTASASPGGTAAPLPSASAAPPPAAGAAAPPPAASVVSPVVTPPPPAAPLAAAAPSCAKERDKLKKTLTDSQKSLDQFNECLRRTKNDETICHRYKLYVEDAQKKESADGQKLGDCLNGGLSVTLRGALSRELPGHAAVSVETRADGAVVLWAFSPVAQTGFAVDVTSAGVVVARAPLAANQLQWLRQQLGF
ncbi:MAG: hypothetical protein A2289_24160 [Deltaproteobacteria bacterium RIFOXYA12_FULL_58_15]|nr:MAG: hypothetical protein A2289_24160 [Deltaproteobacteria bacterium RIFOXYA12_FULL_58_15]